LHTEKQVKARLSKTKCDALMLGRGPVRDPFIFLKPFIQDGEDISFSANDYLEVIRLFNALMEEQDMRPRHHMIQLRKHIVWFAQGFPGVAKFRQTCFQTNTSEDAMKVAEDFFGNLQSSQKHINPDESFMAGGHG
jgi:tRNA-dihydrouridine synthase B